MNPAKACLDVPKATRANVRKSPSQTGTHFSTLIIAYFSALANFKIVSIKSFLLAVYVPRSSLNFPANSYLSAVYFLILSLWLCR